MAPTRSSSARNNGADKTAKDSPVRAGTHQVKHTSPVCSSDAPSFLTPTKDNHSGISLKWIKPSNSGRKISLKKPTITDIDLNYKVAHAIAFPIKDAPKDSQGFAFAMVHPQQIAKGQYITYPFANEVEKGKVFGGHFEFVPGRFELHLNGILQKTGKFSVRCFPIFMQVDHWTPANWREVMDLVVSDYMGKNYRTEGWTVLVPPDFLKDPVVWSEVLGVSKAHELLETVHALPTIGGLPDDFGKKNPEIIKAYFREGTLSLPRGQALMVNTDMLTPHAKAELMMGSGEDEE